MQALIALAGKNGRLRSVVHASGSSITTRFANKSANKGPATGGGAVVIAERSPDGVKSISVAFIATAGWRTGQA